MNSGQKIRRIVVGLDGSQPARVALEWAIALAASIDAEIVAVHALEQPMPISTPGRLTPLAVDRWDEAWQEWRQEARRQLEEDWSAPLRDAGLQHRTMMVEGTAAAALLDAAAAEDADLIVVGSRGLGGLGRLLLGSISSQVANRSERPVAIVPTPEEED